MDSQTTQSSSIHSRKTNFLINAIFSSQNLAKQLSYQFFSIFARILGASGLELGFMTAGQNASQTALQSYFGKKSDMRDRRIFLIIGSLIAGLAYLVASFSRNPFELILGIIINGIGISILAPSLEGTISDNISKERRSRFIGNMNSIGTYYAATMIFIIGLIFIALPSDNQVIGYRIITIFAGINFIAALLLAIFLPKRQIDQIQHQEEKFSMFEPLKDKKFRRFLVLVIFWWVSMSVAWSYFPVYFSDILKLSIFELSIINTIFSVAMGVSSYFGGKLNGKYGPKYGLMLGLGTFWMFPLALAFSNNFVAASFAQLLAGISLGMGIPAIQTYIIEISGNRTGQYSGLYFLFWGVFTFIGSLSGGYLLDYLEAQLGLKQAIFVLLIGVAIFRLFTGSLLFLVQNTEPKAVV